MAETVADMADKGEHMTEDPSLAVEQCPHTAPVRCSLAWGHQGPCITGASDQIERLTAAREVLRDEVWELVAKNDRLRGENEILQHDVAVLRAELAKWNIHGWWDAKTSPADSHSGTETNLPYPRGPEPGYEI